MSSALPNLDRRQQLILASARYHGRQTASTHRVLKHAMLADGAWDAAMEANAGEIFSGEADDKHPVFADWYTTLIEMTYEPEATRLLEGLGNLGTGNPTARAGAYFTGCVLTDAGKVVAEQFLAAYPEFEPALRGSGGRRSCS
jgi:hypothetical protein